MLKPTCPSVCLSVTVVRHADTVHGIDSLMLIAPYDGAMFLDFVVKRCCDDFWVYYRVLRTSVL